MDISEQNICNILPTIEYCGAITSGEGILRVDDEEKKAMMLMIGLLRTKIAIWSLNKKVIFLKRNLRNLIWQVS